MSGAFYFLYAAFITIKLMHAKEKNIIQIINMYSGISVASTSIDVFESVKFIGLDDFTICLENSYRLSKQIYQIFNLCSSKPSMSSNAPLG